MEARTRWTAAIFLFIALDAASLQIRGALLPRFEASFDVSAGLLGLVAPAGTIGFVLAVLVVGFAAGRVPVGATVLASVVAAAALLGAMALSPVYVLFIGALALHGIALGGVRGLDRVVLSHLYPSRRGRIFTLHGLAWAVGAVSGPALAAVVVAFLDWRAAIGLLAVGFLPVLALVYGLDVPAGIENEQPISTEALSELARKPAILAMTGGLLLVGGIEGAIFTWLPYYAGESLPGALAPLALSAYLLAYVPGRVAYTAVSERIDYRLLTFALALGAIPAMYLALVVASGYALLASVFLLGLFMSGQFPLISAIGVEAAPEYSGPANAIGTSATYVGIAVVPAIMGVLIDAYTVGAAMVLPVVLSVGVALVLGGLWLARRR
jgi:fucose permease